jgi:hypothetical protein
VATAYGNRLVVSGQYLSRNSLGHYSQSKSAEKRPRGNGASREMHDETHVPHPVRAVAKEVTRVSLHSKSSQYFTKSASNSNGPNVA